MEVCVRLDAARWPEAWPRVIVVVLVVIVMTIATVKGYTMAEVLTVVLGGTLAASPRVLVASWPHGRGAEGR